MLIKNKFLTTLCILFSALFIQIPTFAANTVFFGRFIQDEVVKGSEEDALVRSKTTDDKGRITIDGIRYQEKDWYYYKDAPIEWYIIKDMGDSVILLSKYILGASTYDGTVAGSVFWDHSSIREYLNTDFMNEAFTEAERSQLIPVNLTTNEHTYESLYTVRDNAVTVCSTSDKVFLLSKDDLIDGTYAITDKSMLIASPSVFVKYNQEPMKWWLRGPRGWNYGNQTAIYVNEEGEVDWWYGTYDRGLRPCICVSKGTPGLSQTNPGPLVPSSLSQTPAKPTPEPAAKKITVKFNANGSGASVKTSKKTVTVGKKYGKLPTATRKGYTFKGWYTKKSGGTKVTSSTTVTKKKTHTLYAHWTKKGSSSSESKGKLYAVIIAGCNDKDNGYTYHGATEFCNKLKKNKLKEYTTKESNIKLVKINKPAPTRKKINASIIDSFKNTTREDLSIVYYAGHGRPGESKGSDGLGIFLSDNNYEDYYSYSDFLDLLKDNIKGKIILIVDACFSGGFVKAVSSSVVKNRICIFASSLSTQASQSYSELAMKYKWSKILTVLTDVFRDKVKKGSSVYHCFTFAMMEGLGWNSNSKIPADSDGDKVVTTTELKNYITNHMPFGEAQIPRFHIPIVMNNQPFFGY